MLWDADIQVEICGVLRQGTRTSIWTQLSGSTLHEGGRGRGGGITLSPKGWKVVGGGCQVVAGASPTPTRVWATLQLGDCYLSHERTPADPGLRLHTCSVGPNRHFGSF